MPPNAMPRPAPLACRECRRKHLKCDGARPICMRCAMEGLVCEYSPSRRGYGRRRVQGERLTASNPPVVQHTPHPLTPISSASASTGGPPPPASIADSTPLSAPSNGYQTLCSPAARSARVNFKVNDKELLINAFYTHFHPAHPVLVPRQFYARQHYPEELERVVLFIGQSYVTRASDQDCMTADARDLSILAGIERTISGVQALVLCSILLHSLCFPEQALTCIRRAGVVARELRLNHMDVEATGSALQSVEAESVRRTWWELYIVDSYLATLHRRSTFACDPEDIYPLLPGSTRLHNADIGDSTPPSLARFEGRVFSAQPGSRIFSADCYRIEAIRILRRVSHLSSNPDTCTDDVEALDNAIASWKHYLPEKSTNFAADALSEADPLLFQAHCFVQIASILLHFPRSDLPPSIPSTKDFSCSRNWTHGVPTCSQHSMKAIAASKDIANLAAIPFPVDFYSPLFTCALIVACIVQLAASSVQLAGQDNSVLLRHRDRVALLLGALSQLGRKWKMASHGASLLRQIADRIFNKSSNNEQLEVDGLMQSDGLGDDGDLWNDMSWFDLFSAVNMDGNIVSSDIGTSQLDST